MFFVIIVVGLEAVSVFLLEVSDAFVVDIGFCIDDNVVDGVIWARVALFWYLYWIMS